MLSTAIKAGRQHHPTRRSRMIEYDPNRNWLRDIRRLVASGRIPNTDEIGLDFVGVERDERDFIRVDERCHTTPPGVWAVGDCSGNPRFTHIADDDFREVRDNLAGIDPTMTNRLVPFCLFTDPELARVGLSEAEAESRGIAYKLAKIPVTLILRSRTLSEPRGFYEVLVAADSDLILGFTVLAPGAGEPSNA
jgi:pyruvate/2-oxoglutarate dehydrogenase complex dihydrolipoamide dehydrogenase (E3) component